MARPKSSSKTRTSSSKKKNLKLKWWYVLPVVAIVAVAGYAIVRSSQASYGQYAYRNLSTKPPLYCVGGTRVSKGNFYYPYCNITNKTGVYAAAGWTPIMHFYSSGWSYYGPNNKFCVSGWFTKGAVIKIRSEIIGPAGSYITTTTPMRYFTAPTEGSHEVCVDLTAQLGVVSNSLEASRSSSVKLYVYNSNGGTNVGSMYMR